MAYTETALYCDSVAYNAVAMWTASTAYTVGQIVRQRTAPTVGNERCFVCYQAGTSAGTEPAWSTAIKGSSFTDNTVKWTECTALPGVNGDAASTNAWRPSITSPGLGAVIKNTAATHYFLCTAGGGGSGASSEPSWNTTAGATTVDGSVTWTCLGSISNFTTRWAAPAARLAHLLNNNTTWLANAGMTIYVGDDHAESASGTQSFVNGFECRVVCVDHTVALPPTSADLRTTASVTLSGSGNLNYSLSSAATTPLYTYGLQLIYNASNASGLTLGNAAGNRSRFEQCAFYEQATTSSGRIVIGSVGAQLEFKNCVFRISDPSQFLNLVGGTEKLEGCSFIAPTFASNNALLGGNGSCSVVFEGSDLSLIAGANLFNTSTGIFPFVGYALFKDCGLPSSFTVYRTGNAAMPHGALIDLVRCDSGGTNYRNERHDMNAAETTSTAIVRTGGAADGSTPISHQVALTANANNTSHVFNALSFAKWNATTGSRTVTLYGIANDSRVPKNDEVWFDAEYLGSSSSPKGSFVSTRALMLAAGAALTADTSAWDSAVTARANSTAYVVGDARKAASNPGRVFWCTGAGTSAASEPTAIAASANTFNPSDKTASVTLSGGNLTAVGSAGSQAVRSIGAQSGGKIYLEYLINVASGAAPGILNGATAIASFGSSSAGGSFVLSTGAISYNGGATGLSLGTISNGQTVCIAVDLVNKLLWYRVNSGNWNGIAGNNPATGIGGIDISSVFSGSAVYAAVALSTSSSVTANFGGSSFAFTPPSGFSAGPAQAGYSTAVDGDGIADGTATFRAGFRWKIPVSISPQQAGYVYVYPKFGRASQTYWIDPKISLS